MGRKKELGSTARAAANHCSSIAKQVVGQRFGPDKVVQPDMLGSFVAHGLTQSEAESETLVQMCVPSSSQQGKVALDTDWQR